MLKNNTYDAIVIGSGITGGWAAKELTEKGLKTLVLERGRNVEHIKDYPTANLPPWKFQHRGFDTRATKDQYPVQCTNYAFNESTMHFYVNDRE
ncbi:MAG: GMC family oxidoreductase, partial [Cyclobacteriaceae bacterium]|nr:GMC family oxidoreductase [Cyclobacteriaceae bacterium]